MNQYAHSVLAVICALASGVVRAEGALEIPGPGSVQSGIGVFSGWHCTANRIEIQIDNGPLLLAGARTERVDTFETCGRIDTGFSLLFNYNRLRSDAFGGAIHTVTAWADGRPFAGAEFRIEHFGVEMLTGKKAVYELPNFPDIGKATWVTWDEAKQNFSITSTCCRSSPVGIVADTYYGTYYGAFRGGAQNPICGPFSPASVRPVKHGTFSVRLGDGQMSLTADFVDGTSCRAAGGAIEPFISNNSDGLVTGRFTAAAAAACPDFANGLVVKVDGRRLLVDGADGCQTGHVMAAQ